MQFINVQLIVLSTIFIIFAVNNLRIRIKRGVLLTAVTGMHVTFLFFFGIGSLFYAIFGVLAERESRYVINEKINLAIPYLLFGYLIITIIEYSNRNKISLFNKNLLNIFKTTVNLNKFNLFIFSISFFGITFASANSELAISGSGTIFPVLGNFLFPITILIVYNFNKNDLFSIILFVLLFILVGYNAFISAWRSQLIIFIACVLIGWNLKGSLNYYLVASLFLIIIFVILPFQQIKKSGGLGLDTEEAFDKSIDYSYADRLAVASSFFAERINYSRELGYIQNGMDKGYMPYRNGETYLEVAYQLIPRVLWKDKPSYNVYTNRDIPHTFNLLSTLDKNTSWAVNCFAEFLYNYTYKYLPFFLLLFYFILVYFDRLSQKIVLLPEFTWLLQTTLFFLSMNLVSVIFASTYFLWTFLIVIILNTFSTLGSNLNKQNR